MNPIYQHTQFSAMPLMIIGPVLVYTGGLMITTGFEPISWVMFLFLAWVMVAMINLTVTVDRQAVKLAFGLGFPRKTTRLDQIAGLRVVQNSPLAGIGIRRTLTGWLYTIGGRESVLVELRDGSSFRIGSDEAPALLRAIETALIERHPRG